MPTVYEQLLNHHAQQAKNTAALLAKHPGVSMFSHPKTGDYFKALMQRWQSSHDVAVLSNATGKE